MEEAVQHMKSKITQEGRCPVCTLKIPCKHYASVEDMPRAITPIRNISLPPCPKRITNENYLKEPEFRNTSFESSKKLSFRTRVKNSYNEEPAALIEYKEEEKRKQKLKETESKLIKLSKIEAYREDKIRKEIQKLEEEKQKEEEDIFREQIREMNRKKYLDQQKKKLDEFQRLKDQELREIKIKLKKEEEDKKKNEQKKIKYIEEQKKKLVDYHTKKKMIEEVTMDQIDELSKRYLAKEVLLKKKASPYGSNELS